MGMRREQILKRAKKYKTHKRHNHLYAKWKVAKKIKLETKEIPELILWIHKEFREDFYFSDIITKNTRHRSEIKKEILDWAAASLEHVPEIISLELNDTRRYALLFQNVTDLIAFKLRWL